MKSLPVVRGVRPDQHLPWSAADCRSTHAARGRRSGRVRRRRLGPAALPAVARRRSQVRHAAAGDRRRRRRPAGHRRVQRRPQRRRGDRRARPPRGAPPVGHARPLHPDVQAAAAPAGAARRRQARALRPPGRGAARPLRDHGGRQDRAGADGLRRQGHRRRGDRLGSHAQPRRPALRRQHHPAGHQVRRLRQRPDRPLRRLGPRHARRRHHRRQRLRLARHPRRHRPGGHAGRAQGARRRRAGAASATIIQALDWAVANRAAYNIRVINMSLGAGVFESYNTDPLTLAAKRAVDAGIVVVAAAGNIGRNASGDPQYGAITAPGQRSVGAHRRRRRTPTAPPAATTTRWRRSARAGRRCIDCIAKPDLVAPGTGVVSLSSPGSKMYVEKAQYLVNGSAPDLVQAVPHAERHQHGGAGGQRHGGADAAGQPELTPNLVKAILQYTAEVHDGLRLPHPGRRLPERARRGHAGEVLQGRQARQPLPAVADVEPAHPVGQPPRRRAA